MNKQSSLLIQILGFANYLVRKYPLFYVVIALSLVILLLEYLATSLMIPLSPSQEKDSLVVSSWTWIVTAIGMPPTFRTWLWIFILLMCLRLILGYVLSVLTTLLGKTVHKNLSEKIFGHVVQAEPMEQVYERSIGHYINLAGDDTFKGGTIVANLLQSVVGLLSATVGLIVLYEFSSFLFFGLVTFLIVSLTLVLILMRIMIRLNDKSTLLSREANTTFIEVLNSLRSIRSLHGERFAIGTYASQIHRYTRMLVEIDAIKMGVKAFPAIMLLLMAAIILRPNFTVDMSDAVIFAGIVIIIRVFSSLGLMMTAGSQLLTDIRAIKDISSIVKLAQEEDVTREQVVVTPVRTIALQQVSFGYGGRGAVLSDVNFCFEAGHIYAIIGPSGSGKSTLADILLGHYLPDSGSVVINNGNLPLELARARLALVEQQPKIFSTTVRDNLLMGQNFSDEILCAALEAVNLDDMVYRLDRGLDTRLTYLGENFSGGQRQRLGIARALIRQPDALILDEATSALDPITCKEVVAKLRLRMRYGIIIFITHDKEIATFADRVLTIGSHQLTRW